MRMGRGFRRGARQTGRLRAGYLAESVHSVVFHGRNFRLRGCAAWLESPHTVSDFRFHLRVGSESGRSSSSRWVSAPFNCVLRNCGERFRR